MTSFMEFMIGICFGIVLHSICENIFFLGIQNSVERKEVTASSVCDGFYVGCVFVNVVFIIGFLIKSVKRLCNLNCLSSDNSNDS